MNNMILSYAILFIVLYSMRNLTAPKSLSRLCITYILTCLALAPIALLTVFWIAESKVIVMHDDYYLGLAIGIVLFGAASITGDTKL